MDFCHMGEVHVDAKACRLDYHKEQYVHDRERTQRVELGEEDYTSEVYERADDEDDEYRDGCCEAPHFVVYLPRAVYV